MIVVFNANIVIFKLGQKVSGQSRGKKRERGRKKDIDSSDDESFDQEYSRWSEYARTRAKSKSPQPPKMPLLSGSGKPTFEAFMYQFERTAGRIGWTGAAKTVYGCHTFIFPPPFPPPKKIHM